MRQEEIDRFWRPNGPQFLVSSRAGGEGINLQVARRLVHIDVPWNPMELEQRVGRVHRFGSRETILLDTLVMRNSREEEAYAVADQKLRMITRALVAPDRFDALFSRVMTLIPPEELQEALLRHQDGGGGVDVEKIGQLVQEGFAKWKAFHDKYSSEQKKIEGLNPGLAAWEDVYEFLCEYAGARPVDGYSVLRFLLKEGEVKGARRGSPRCDVRWQQRIRLWRLCRGAGLRSWQCDGAATRLERAGRGDGSSPRRISRSGVRGRPYSVAEELRPATRIAAPIWCGCADEAGAQDGAGHMVRGASDAPLLCRTGRW